MIAEVRTLHLGKKSWALSVIESYVKKISHFQKIEFKQVKDEAKLLIGIDDRDFVIALDERGKAPSSREFSSQFQKILESGKQKIVFIIGGPFGLTPECKERANETLSLSHFVFNQELASVVLFEQIFRAHTIINNHPYHND